MGNSQREYVKERIAREISRILFPLKIRQRSFSGHVVPAAQRPTRRAGVEQLLPRGPSYLVCSGWLSSTPISGGAGEILPSPFHPYRLARRADRREKVFVSLSLSPYCTAAFFCGTSSPCNELRNGHPLQGSDASHRKTGARSFNSRQLTH